MNNMSWNHRQNYRVDEAVQDFINPANLHFIRQPKDINLDLFFFTVRNLPKTTSALQMSHAVNRRLKQMWTYTRIGREAGVTGERAAQVCRQAGRILRHTSNRRLYERPWEWLPPNDSEWPDR